MPLDPVLALGLRAALALVLGSAALHKLRDLRSFHDVVEAYRLSPAAATSALAAAVVSAEIVACAALLAPGAPAAGPLLAAGLFALYGVAIGVNLARGRTHLDCGCGGPSARQPIRGWLLARNAALVAAALLALTPPTTRPLVWVDVITLFGALVVLAAAWTSLHRLAAEPLGASPVAAERAGRPS